MKYERLVTRDSESVYLEDVEGVEVVIDALPDVGFFAYLNDGRWTLCEAVSGRQACPIRFEEKLEQARWGWNIYFAQLSDSQIHEFRNAAQAQAADAIGIRADRDYVGAECEYINPADNPAEG